ncbi:MAG: hypothetical protein AAGD43_02895 [Pseudomonadota bacterium]
MSPAENEKAEFRLVTLCLHEKVDQIYRELGKEVNANQACRALMLTASTLIGTIKCKKEQKSLTALLADNLWLDHRDRLKKQAS